MDSNKSRKVRSYTPGNARLKSKKEQIKVSVRMRPMLQPYESDSIWHVDTDSKLVFTNLSKKQFMELDNGSPYAMTKDGIRSRKLVDPSQNFYFNFDNVFDESSTTPQIYHTIARPITKAALNGYNGSVFMYGQTTSGKTYTMLGTPKSPGILPCTLRDIFTQVNKDVENTYKIKISYLEIYNESINDLLVPGSSNLKIKDDKEFGVKVVGLKSQQVWTFEQALILMNYGEEHRVYKETSIHDHSSRSHTIFRIYVESSPKNKQGFKKTSMLNLIDLAGSERLNEFEHRKDTLGETGHINKSLFILSNVINKLAEGKHSHIPYRDSKLTRILSMALGGNSLTAIICTVTPASVNHYQTLSTLRFATRAKSVKNKPTINALNHGNNSVELYKRQMNKLKKQLEDKDKELTFYVKQNDEMQKHLDSFQNINEHILSQMSARKSESPHSILNDEFYNSETPNKSQNDSIRVKELQKELDVYKSKCDEYEEIHLQRQKQDAFETMIVNIENSIQEEGNQRLMNGQKRIAWENEAGMLLSQYQDDLKEMHDKYIQQLCVLYRKNLPKIPTIDDLFLDYNQKMECYLNIVKLNSSNATIEEQNTEQEQDDDEEDQISLNEFEEIEESALRVLEDIQTKMIFEDIVIDFGNILDNIKPQEDPQKVNNMLVAYYEEIHEVLQKRLDECQDIIEEYMTHLIENKKRDLHAKMESYTMGEDINVDPNKISDLTKNEITKITEDHNSNLKQLRRQYDEFLKSAEAEFFQVLKMIKINTASAAGQYNMHNHSDHSQNAHSENTVTLGTESPGDKKLAQSHYQSQYSRYKSENSSSKKSHGSSYEVSQTENRPEYETGELAKVAREFLAQQDKNNGISTTGESDGKEKPLTSSDSNIGGPLNGIYDYKPNHTGDNRIKVNDLINNEYARQGVSVFDFNYKPGDKENESDISFTSNIEYVDYNKEAMEGGYLGLSANKISKGSDHESASSYYGSTKKHLEYPG
ncbi:unnamed protein product [Moneuplotes crassus]|uniref:Kinesin-like protein n=1 Tax=Euplotes crassus TaxID=5936 RepID=A0AAD1XYA5_EUPCR|nr:unnamed protein product [Moneuplotes crassus]